MIEKYMLKQEVGSGQFGQVFLGINTLTNAQVAVKQMPLNKFA